MRFKRGQEVTKAAGIGRIATGVHIIATKDWGSHGGLVRTKLKTTRRVLKNLMLDPKWYNGYNGHIFIELAPQTNFEIKEKYGELVRPRELAGKTLIYKGRLYPLVPLPEEP